ncbi:type II secretion system protein GspM [Ferrimonas balearica]|uniref:type II secretion system protein GspM n=1 Tax=Ferrimonas balearica TaxID=44012 RepID=UPI001C996D9C|nr:type II secretion system protein GspM [Ferrimonas balearica]MBY5993139.1 type II secretion system protein M [Ferrimonas balearica]
MNAWTTLNRQFDALSRRERGLIALTSLVGLALLLWALVLDPMAQANSRLEQGLDRSQQQAKEMKREMRQLQSQLAGNPNDELNEKLAKLKTQLTDAQAALEEELVDLILPEQMSGVLAQLLARTEGVTLIAMRIQPPEALVEEGGLYRHGVHLELEGSYFKLMDALERMEQLEQRFYWRLLDYQVTRYPKARLQLRLDTLGTEKEPIRVGTHTDAVAADRPR